MSLRPSDPAVSSIRGSIGHHDGIDPSGVVRLRHASRLHHIGIGRAHAGTRVIMLIHDLDIRVVEALTGEPLRALTLDLNRDYQPHDHEDTPDP